MNRPRCSHDPARLRSMRAVLPSVCHHVMIAFVISNHHLKTLVHGPEAIVLSELY
jgi:hypothetical protein